MSEGRWADESQKAGVSPQRMPLKGSRRILSSPGRADPGTLVVGLRAPLPATPSPTVFRDQGSPPQVGVVGRFLYIAPILLHGVPAVQVDWWADCVEAELAAGPATPPTIEVETPNGPRANNDWWVNMVQFELLGPAREATNAPLLPPPAVVALPAASDVDTASLEDAQVGSLGPSIQPPLFDTAADGS